VSLFKLFATKVVSWARWRVRLAVYWAQVGAGFFWFHTGESFLEKLQNHKIRKFIQRIPKDHARGSTELLNQLQIWSDDYQQDVDLHNSFAGATITSNMIVFSPLIHRTRDLKNQVRVNDNPVRIRIRRAMRFRNIALIVVHILRTLGRFGPGPIRRTQIVKEVLRNPLLLANLRHAFLVEIDWNESVKSTEDLSSANLVPLRVVPQADIFARTLAPLLSSIVGITVLSVSTRLVNTDQKRGSFEPLVRISSISLEQFLNLQLYIRCERALREFQSVVRGSPFSIFGDYLLGVNSRGSDNVLALQQGVPVTDAPNLHNLVSHSQFRSRQVITIRDADILHERFIVTDSRLVVMENGADCRADSVAGLWPFVFGSPTCDGQILVANCSSGRRYVKSAIAGFGRVDSNWFHFVVETLPRVLATVDACTSESPVLIQRELLPAGRQALQALTHRELIELGDETVHVGELHVGIGTSSTMDTPFRGDLVGDFDNDSLIDTRSRLLDVYPPAEGGGRRIFMLRKSNYRRVTNLRKLQRILLRYDFEPVDMSELSLQKQIETMQQCDVVVTQGGAAMTNLMFARPGTKLIGLVGPAGTQDRYWSNYLNVFDIQSTFLIGHSRKTKRPPVIHDDFSIDTIKFEECLSHLA